MSDALEIRALGELNISHAGKPLCHMPSRKIEALLVYLACTRRPQHREMLAEMFYPGRTQSQAQTDLRVSLSYLRRCLPTHLIITRHTAAANPESDIWVDVQHLEEVILRAGKPLRTGLTDEVTLRYLHGALDLYEGDFLSGFCLPGSPAFEHWALLERERLRATVTGTMLCLATLYAERGDLFGSEELAARLLAIDPSNEEAHHFLMLLLARSGRRSAALAQYERCRRSLQAELDAEPGPQIRAAYQHIRAGLDPVTGSNPA